ncbi:hypothetical protein GCM10025331_57860 [Actinoplanes utahensis]|nr:hypothetical protein Aut01nite_58620 [Actinoplanes utahensis]
MAWRGRIRSIMIFKARRFRPDYRSVARPPRTTRPLRDSGERPDFAVLSDDLEGAGRGTSGVGCSAAVRARTPHTEGMGARGREWRLGGLGTIRSAGWPR